MKQILLVDDDIELSRMLAEYLQLEGFDADCVHDGTTALARLEQQHYDLMVLDVMMPGLNGFDTLKQVRRQHRLPVLMMSARGEEVDRIIGLEVGADDYLPKPCSPRELVARINANLRRVSLEQQPEASALLTINGLWIDTDTLRAGFDDQNLELTHTEFVILRLLMEQQGKLVTRDNLMRQALNRRLGPFDRSIDMHLSNLRRKLGPAHPDAVEIRTVRGSGYMLIKGATDADS
ncbi:response regulator transcription factor [Motiliproteus sediminis]|uniref:response regulator transcription factor n=1 Tax=Motiliproteus sediminis TaxID=1468178 RepID=UPI001AF01EE9|nr:response regulator transcription factor [Motiliproteus sediminis]